MKASALNKALPILLQLTVLILIPVGIKVSEINAVKIKTEVTTDEQKGSALKHSYSLVFPFSRLSVENMEKGEGYKINDAVYVTLTKGVDDIWRPAAFSHTKPSGVLYIKGKVTAEPTNIKKWEIVIEKADGSRQLYYPDWFPFVSGDSVFFCLDRNGRPVYSDRSTSTGGCWEKDWEKVEGTVLSAKETGGGYLGVEYGIENYFTPHILNQSANQVEKMKAEISVINGIPIVNGIK